MAQQNPVGLTTDDAFPTQLSLATQQQSSDTPVRDVNSANDVDLYQYISDRGFHFPRELVTRYLLALRTKPFVMFSGISGTGKSKLALLTAEYYAQFPGTQAIRHERPEDSDHQFFVPLDRVTLRSGTLTPHHDQYDYFDVPIGGTATFSTTITNILGAHGDMTFRAACFVISGRKHVTLSVPASVRRAFEETGVREGDYLCFEIVEEYKRYRVSLHRPEPELITVPEDHRLAFVSVRPSWHDHTAMLGEYNDDRDAYVRTPVLELLLRAHREQEAAHELGCAAVPYFVVLDEMNLAQIEHYFSDFLSALESRRKDQSGEIRQAPLHLHGADAHRLTWVDALGVEYEIPERMEIPTNVLFTGTVNLDESTNGLSPKVVDRANTICFSGVDFSAFLRDDASLSETDSPLVLSAEQTRDVGLGRLELAHRSDSMDRADQLEPLAQLNEMLVPHDLHFGYRVLNDIGLMMRIAHESLGDIEGLDVAVLDAAVLQKILPRFFMWRQDRGGVLAELLAFCLDGEHPGGAIDARQLRGFIDVSAAEVATWRPQGDFPRAQILLPRSAGRLARMLDAMGYGVA